MYSRRSSWSEVLMAIGFVVVLLRIRDCAWIVSYVGVAMVAGELPTAQPHFVGEGEGHEAYRPEEEQEYGYWKKEAPPPATGVNPLVGAAVGGLGVALMGAGVAWRIANRAAPAPEEAEAPASRRGRCD